LFEFLAQIIKTLEENRGALQKKFEKGKRWHIIADLLEGSFQPPVWPKGYQPAGEMAQKVEEFYRVLHEFDRKFEFMGAMPDRFIKFYNTYLNRLKQIHKQLTEPAKE
jgi:hypothetical protein